MAQRPHQDWTEVKLKPRPAPGAKKQEVKSAMQATPQAVTTIKKGIVSLLSLAHHSATGGTNKQQAKSDFDARALDKDEGDYEGDVINYWLLTFSSQDSRSSGRKSNSTRKTSQGYDTKRFGSGMGFDISPS